MAKIEVTPISSGYNIQALNTTLQAIEDEFKNKVVYRDEVSPLEQNLDVNGFGLINVDTINGADVTIIGDVGAAVTQAEEAAAEAEASAISAAANAAIVAGTKLIWRGAWSGATAYAINDAVGVGGRSYIATAPSTNQSPPNLSFWDILADRGTDGANGTGAGDVTSNTATSVDNEIAVMSGTTGKVIKRAVGSGIAKITNGVLSTAVADTDYTTPATFATAMLLTGAQDAEGIKTFKDGIVVEGAAYTPSFSPIHSATPTFDCAVSNVFEPAALTSNVTSMTLSNPVAGQTINIRFFQDGTGGRTVAVPAGSKVSGTVNTAINGVSWLILTYSGRAGRWEGAWSQVPA
jgi:hypothetical protein